MLTPETSAGTTLAILQAYPLGTLEVQEINRAEPRRGLLKGTICGEETTDLDYDGLKIRWSGNAWADVLWHRPSLVLPVLLPFRALCDELPDGTIPAETLAEVVKQSSRYMEIFLRSGAVIKQRKGESEGELDRVEIWGEHTATAVFTIFSDFTFYTALQTDYAVICDTLRRLHFALPVNGRPLVEGVDYIAKASPKASPGAAAPVLEKEPSRA